MKIKQVADCFDLLLDMLEVNGTITRQQRLRIHEPLYPPNKRTLIQRESKLENKTKEQSKKTTPLFKP
jgi:hypothetical protein